jgi:uncharacterized protein (TIGR03083 family)
VDLKHVARDERADLAALLATLSPQQWEAPTLCAGWRVRDVVAHMISYDELDGRDLLRRFTKGRFRPDRVNAIGLAEYNKRSPEELLALLKEHLEPRGLMPGERLGECGGGTGGIHGELSRPFRGRALVTSRGQSRCRLWSHQPRSCR